MKNKNELSVAIGLVILIYFFSGVCSLIDEVVWVRLLKLTLGNTVYASSIVVSVFMGGLALGALIMSRYSDRIKKRLRLYAILELFATISALLFPLLLKQMDHFYRYIFIRSDPSSHMILFFQVIVSAILLLFPAMAMGSTLPLLGRYITSLHEKIGNLVGKLYALNMLGAALGCFLAGFVLIRILGVMGTIYLAAGINLLVATGGWILSRSYDFSSEETASHEKTTQDDTGKAKLIPLVLIAAFFLSGFISIGYELIWMRSIVFILGGPTYVFSAVLTIYLLGNVTGAWAGSRLSKRIKNPALAFGISLTILGILGIFYIHWLDIWKSDLLKPLVSSTHKIWETAYIRTLFFPVFNSFFLFIIPSIAMGIGFPFALQAWSNFRFKVGKTTGTVYGANTIGAVLGGLLVGFLFIPYSGVQRSVILLGLTGIWIGSIMIMVFWTQLKIHWRTSLVGVAIVLTVIAFSFPSDLFTKQFVDIAARYVKVLAVEEGLNTTVSVHENEKGERILATSNVQVAGDPKGFRVTQKILGHMGILLNENSRRMLTVGFGSGESSNCMSKHELDGVDVVEIAPELVKLSLKYFSHINLGDSIDDKNVRIIYMDAKNYLHLTDNTYDVIVTDAINPRSMAENASLYTKEYFINGMDRLNPGGILGCWLPLQEIPVSCVNSILGTFTEVFPYVTIWLPVTAPSKYDFLYLAGSKEPQKYSPRHIEEELGKRNVAKSLEYINFYNAHDVLSCYITDKKGLENYLTDYHVNSDYTPYLEFNTELEETRAEKRQWLQQFIKQVKNDDVYDKIDWAGFSDKEQKKWLENHQMYSSAADILLLARVENDPVDALQDCYYGMMLMPENIAFKQQEEYALLDLYNQIKNNKDIDDILYKVNTFIQKDQAFGTAWLVRSWACDKIKRNKEAYIAAEYAARNCTYNPMAQYNLGSILLKMQQYERSAEYLKKAVQLDSLNTLYHNDLIKAYAMGKKYNEALTELFKLADIEPDNYKIYFNIGEIYFMFGKRKEAIAAYRRCLQIKPDFYQAKNKLMKLSM